MPRRKAGKEMQEQIWNAFVRERSEDERISIFAESMQREESSPLRKLEREALGDGVPIIRPQTRGLIKFILEVLKPQNILEIGAAVGYSALLMYTYAPNGCHITTIERDEGRARLARTNFERFGTDPGRLRLIEGDAAQILPELSGSYDLVFMDAAKGQYIRFLSDVKRLLRTGGALLSDNILRGGEILQSRYAVTRRNRTIHRRMREYLEALCGDPDFVTVILEDGDGMALSVRKRVPDHETAGIL